MPCNFDSGSMVGIKRGFGEWAEALTILHSPPYVRASILRAGGARD
jgi:hypothetical protein